MSRIACADEYDGEDSVPHCTSTDGAFLRVGDELVAVNDMTVRDMALDDVVILLSVPQRLALHVRRAEPTRACHLLGAGHGNSPRPVAPLDPNSRRPAAVHPFPVPPAAIAGAGDDSNDSGLSSEHSMASRDALSRQRVSLHNSLPPQRVRFEEAGGGRQQPHQYQQRHQQVPPQWHAHADSPQLLYGTLERAPHAYGVTPRQIAAASQSQSQSQPPQSQYSRNSSSSNNNNSNCVGFEPPDATPRARRAASRSHKEYNSDSEFCGGAPVNGESAACGAELDSDCSEREARAGSAGGGSLRSGASAATRRRSRRCRRRSRRRRPTCRTRAPPPRDIAPSARITRASRRPSRAPPPPPPPPSTRRDARVHCASAPSSGRFRRRRRRHPHLSASASTSRVPLPLHPMHTTSALHVRGNPHARTPLPLPCHAMPFHSANEAAARVSSPSASFSPSPTRLVYCTLVLVLMRLLQTDPS